MLPDPSLHKSNLPLMRAFKMALCDLLPQGASEIQLVKVESSISIKQNLELSTLTTYISDAPWGTDLCSTSNESSYEW